MVTILQFFMNSDIELPISLHATSLQSLSSYRTSLFLPCSYNSGFTLIQKFLQTCIVFQTECLRQNFEIALNRLSINPCFDK